MMNPLSMLIRRVRSWFALEWVGEDDLYLQSFSSITPTLFVGRRPSADHLEQLHRSRITHVVSCLPETSRVDFAFLGTDFDHLFLPADDEMGQDLTDAITRFMAYVDAARSASGDAKVLVHCEVGVSRSASLAIALIMRDQRLSFLDAFELVRSKRIQVLPNLAFASQLQKLEHQLQPDLASESPSSLAVYLRRYCNAPTDVDELDTQLRRADFDAPQALRAIYGGEIPRVIQGARAAHR